MAPSQIIALIRDVLVVAGIAWLIYTIGEADRIRRQDAEASAKQAAATAAQQARWAQDARDAEALRQMDAATALAAIRAHNAPIIVRDPRGTGAVSGDPAAPAGCPTGAGGSDATAGRDLRPAVSRFEKWVEDRFGDCRLVLREWPKEKPP